MDTPPPGIDRATAWRWLLPAVSPAALKTLGFSGTESALLANLTTTVCDAPAGTVVVVDVDQCRGIIAVEELEAAGCIALIGRRSRIAKWVRLVPGIQRGWRFALLPARDPRVLIPLSSGAATRHGLALHRPGRWTAGIALGLAARLSRVCLAAPLWARQLVLLWRDDCLQPRGLAESGLLPESIGAEGNVGLYLGSDCENRKTTILPMSGATPHRIVKQGATVAASASLRREAKILRQLAQTPLHSRVPRVLKWSEVHGIAAMHLEYRRRSSAPARRVRMEALDFLSVLQCIDASQCPVEQWCDMHLEPTDSITPAGQQLRDALRQAGRQGHFLRLHRVHGDFAPWNCSMTRKGFFVFDWESSQPNGLALSDAFHFELAPALLLRGMSNANAELRAARAIAARLTPELGMDEHALHLQLAGWLATWNAHRSDEGLETLRRESAEWIT